MVVPVPVPDNVVFADTTRLFANISDDVILVPDMFPDIIETLERSRLTKSILLLEPLKSKDAMDTEFTVISFADMDDA